jgi:putative hydrolase of the HAD superfamily
MDSIKIISFDVEGTLVTSDFSYAVWYEAIPELYALSRGIGYREAKQKVEEEYAKVGDQRLEWYDVGHWFNYFGLGKPTAALRNCEAKVCYYPEVFEVLEQLSRDYKLVVVSGSTREFLNHLLKDIKSYFTRIFSSISDYQQLKTKDFYLEVCRELRITPNQIVHIGDNRQFDYDNPRQVGIQAFHLERNKQANSNESVENLRQLQSQLR